MTAVQHQRSRWSTITELLVWVAVAALVVRWPGLLFPAFLALTSRAATRVTQFPLRWVLVSAATLCVVAYVLSSGPAIRVACDLGESETHPKLLSAIFDAYRPLFRMAKATGVHRPLVHYVNWYVGGELGYVSKEALGL